MSRLQARSELPVPAAPIPPAKPEHAGLEAADSFRSASRFVRIRNASALFRRAGGMMNSRSLKQRRGVDCLKQRCGLRGFARQGHLRSRDFEQIQPRGGRQNTGHLRQHIHVTLRAGAQARPVPRYSGERFRSAGQALSSGRLPAPRAQFRRSTMPDNAQRHSAGIKPVLSPAAKPRRPKPPMGSTASAYRRAAVRAEVS